MVEYKVHYGATLKRENPGSRAVVRNKHGHDVSKCACMHCGGHGDK